MYNLRRTVILRTLIMAVLSAAVLILIVSAGSTGPIQAEEDSSPCKQYTSIQIRPGDTLWSIACDYMDGHYSGIQEYIEEVRFINELDTDLIHSGEYLVVPKYINDFN